MAEVQIYRVYENDGHLLYDEVCRSCAAKFQNEGHKTKIDGHLQRYVREENGVTKYHEGHDDEDPEISCIICDEYLISDEEFLEDTI